MKNILKSIIAVFVFSLMTLQLSAQCEFLGAPSGFGATFGTGNNFGQSFEMDASCTAGNQFESVAFSLRNINNFAFDLKIYSGQSDAVADLLYTQTNNVIPGGNVGNVYTYSLGGGTGSLEYTDGQTYSIVCTVISGTAVVEGAGAGNVVSPGNGYFNGGFQNGDLLYSVGTADITKVCASAEVNINPLAGGATLVDFGQTFHAGACGPLTNIAVHTKFANSAQNNGVFQLYSGQSVDPADLLYQVSVTASATSGAAWEKVYYDLSGGTGNNVVVEGQEYTWRLDLGNTIPYGEADLLPGEVSYVNGNFNTGNTFGFYFEFNNAPPPVPTMGEWALITFGLIIMSMGVITVRRREEEMNLQAAS